VAVVVLFLGGSCQFMPGYVAPKEPVRPAVDIRGRRVAVVPVTIPDDLELDEARVRRVESLIEAAMRDAGYDVIPAVRYEAIWDRLSEEAGGFFDPFTGHRDEALFSAAVDQLYREMEQEYHPGAYLYGTVVVAEAMVDDGYAQWDRVALPYPLWTLDDPILALSLEVVVEDSSRVEIFREAVGIGVLEKPDRLDDLTMVPVADRLGSEEEVARAVERVLAPLVRPPDSAAPSR